MNDKENKNCIISFRVTAEEKKWIEDHSYGNYRLISDFVRDCVFKKDIVIINGLDELSAELRSIGTTSTSSRELSTRGMDPRSTLPKQ